MTQHTQDTPLNNAINDLYTNATLCWSLCCRVIALRKLLDTFYHTRDTIRFINTLESTNEKIKEVIHVLSTSEKQPTPGLEP